jgi:hypothetical protein
MSATGLRERLTASLLREIDEVQYPSVTMLDRVEATLAGREELEDYAEVLVRKVEAVHYPSIAMLNRLDGLLDRLEQAERRERQEAAQNDGRGD